MGVTLDAISGANLVGVVQTNISAAFDLSGKNLTEFIAGIKLKAGSDKISVLRIWSHGVTHYSGPAERPYGKGNIKIGDDTIEFDNIETYAASLGVLTPIFDGRARVELRGCQAALGTGAKMMLRMANIWQAEVQGSERSQPMINWVPPVLSATPGATSLRNAVIVEYNEKSSRP